MCCYIILLFIRYGFIIHFFKWLLLFIQPLYTIKKHRTTHYFCILWMIALARQGASSGCMSPYSLKSDSSTLYLIISFAASLIANKLNYLSAWGRFIYAIPRYPPAINAITRGITIQLAKNAFPLDESINPVIVLEPMNIMIEITITIILAIRWEV